MTRVASSSALEPSQASADDEPSPSWGAASIVGLTAGAGHEFNNLVQTVMGSLQLIQKLMISGRAAESAPFIESALRAAQSASTLNQHLVRLAQPHAVDATRLSVNDVIATAQALLRHAVPRSVTLRTDLAADVWPTLCDPNRAEIAVHALVLAVRDAMPSARAITIGSRNRRVEVADPLLVEVPPGDYVCVDVTCGAVDADGVVSPQHDATVDTHPSARAFRATLADLRAFAAENRGAVTFEVDEAGGARLAFVLPRSIGTPE
jgi:signal transduction histidine kinase